MTAMTSTNEGGQWVKGNTWVPAGSVYPSAIYADRPHLIIAPHRNWPIIHREVSEDNPDYPVVLVAPLQVVRGMRIRGYEYRHTDVLEPEQRAYMHEWERLEVRPRVMAAMTSTPPPEGG